MSTCDLCAEHGITSPATCDAQLPGGVWASVCEAHAYRLRSAGCRVEPIDSDEQRREAAGRAAAEWAWED